jgi:hypothetical protein
VQDEHLWRMSDDYTLLAVYKLAALKFVLAVAD